MVPVVSTARITPRASPLPFPGLAAGNGNVAAVDDDAVLIVVNLARKHAVCRIIFKKIGQSGVIRAGVDCRDLKILIVGQQAQQVAADAGRSRSFPVARAWFALLGR